MMIAYWLSAGMKQLITGNLISIDWLFKIAFIITNPEFRIKVDTRS